MRKPFRWYWKHWRTRPNKRPGEFRWCYLCCAIFAILIYIDVSSLQVHQSKSEKYDSVDLNEDDSHAILITKASHKYWIPYDLGEELYDAESSGNLNPGDNIDVSWYSTTVITRISKTRKTVGLRIDDTLYFPFQSTQEVRDEELDGIPLIIGILLFLFFLSYVLSFWWYFFINKTKLLRQEELSAYGTKEILIPELTNNNVKKFNPIFPIKLSCEKWPFFFMVLLGILFFFVIYIDFETFLEILPISLAMIVFFFCGTVSLWKLVHTEISAEQDCFIVKSGKQEMLKYPYAAVTHIAYTRYRHGTAYSIYVGNKKVVVFDTDFTNCKQFIEVLKSKDIVFDTYCRLLWKRIRCKLKRK